MTVDLMTRVSPGLVDAWLRHMNRIVAELDSGGDGRTDVHVLRAEMALPAR